MKVLIEIWQEAHRKVEFWFCLDFTIVQKIVKPNAFFDSNNEDIEFVFLNAPFPFIDYGFLQSAENAATEQRYQWMSYKPEWSEIDFHYDTIKESIEYIIDYINENGTFDGLLGFSQGAVVCLTMLLKIPSGHYFLIVSNSLYCWLSAH